MGTPVQESVVVHCCFSSVLESTTNAFDVLGGIVLHCHIEQFCLDNAVPLGLMVACIAHALLDELALDVARLAPIHLALALFCHVEWTFTRKSASPGFAWWQIWLDFPPIAACCTRQVRVFHPVFAFCVHGMPPLGVQ